MPTRYIKPEGDRKLEFWKTYRGGQHSEFVNVPADWDESDIQEELEDWCRFELHNSEFMRYGWNDEKDFGSRS
jgi:hypothetical protein